ncbi:MAG: hypothetical protein IPI39_26460 [Candidatus Obscuribacter sp.]|nr:hypothetical protein [Candidatus Obscuribacter sp.]
MEINGLLLYLVVPAIMLWAIWKNRKSMSSALTQSQQQIEQQKETNMLLRELIDAIKAKG